MTAADLIALSPLIVLACSTIAIMLIVGLRRNHALTIVLTLLADTGAFALLFVVLRGVPHRVGALLIVDGYSLRGERRPDPRSQKPNPGSAVFVGAAAAAAMFDARYAELLEEGYARVRTGELLARSRYYNHCWTVLSLLMLSGNLVTFPATG